MKFKCLHETEKEDSPIDILGGTGADQALFPISLLPKILQRNAIAFPRPACSFQLPLRGELKWLDWTTAHQSGAYPEGSNASLQHLSIYRSIDLSMYIDLCEGHTLQSPSHDSLSDSPQVRLKTWDPVHRMFLLHALDSWWFQHWIAPQLCTRKI